jgi:hypothetical protein
MEVSSKSDPKILKVHGDCLESNPCQHRCEVIWNENEDEETCLLYAPTIAQFPEAFASDKHLLQHFLKHNHNIARWISRLDDLQNHEIKQEFITLHKTHRPKRAQMVCDALCAELEKIPSITEELKLALTEGYDGIYVLESPDLPLLLGPHKERLVDALNSKLDQERIRNFVMLDMRGGCMQLYLDVVQLELGLPGQEMLVPKSRQ